MNKSKGVINLFYNSNVMHGSGIRIIVFLSVLAVYVSVQSLGHMLHTYTV